MLSVGSINRLNKALEFKDRQLYYVLSTGWPKNKIAEYRGVLKTQITEAGLAMEYLVERGVSSKQIVLEKYSGDTVGNIYFSYSLFFNHLEMAEIKIVSCCYHVERIKKIIKWMEKINIIKSFKTEYIPVFSESTELEALEKIKIKKLTKTTNSITTKKEFLNFIFNKHDYYN